MKLSRRYFVGIALFWGLFPLASFSSDALLGVTESPGMRMIYFQRDGISLTDGVAVSSRMMDELPALLESWPESLEKVDGYVAEIFGAVEKFRPRMPEHADGAEGAFRAGKTPAWDAPRQWFIQIFEGVAFLNEAIVGESGRILSHVEFRLDGGIRCGISCDAQGLPRSFFVSAMAGGRLRTVELSYYPNGKPHALMCSEDGVPAGPQRLWEIDGSVWRSAIGTVAGADPRLLDFAEGDLPPSEYPGTAEESVDATVCDVFIAYGEPGSATMRLSDAPGLTCLVRRDGGRRLCAPALPDARFLCWSGDASGTAPVVEVRGERPVRLVAHYESAPHFADANLRAAVLAASGKSSEAELEGGALAELADFSAPDKGIVDLSGIQFLRGLKRLDVSSNALKTLSWLGSAPWWASGLSAFAPPALPSLWQSVRLAVASECAPRLETLNVSENAAKLESGFMPCPSLREISFSGTEFYSPQWLNMAENLERCVCDRTEYGAFANARVFPKLTYFSFRDNKVRSLAAFREKASPSGALTIDARENPLSEETLCEDVPALETMGIAVLHDGECDASDPRLGTGDGDGDGYSDKEEWRFVCLFSADPARRMEEFEVARHDAGIPLHYLEALSPGVRVKDAKPLSIESIPTESIQVVIWEGEGAVYPFPDQQAFAKYDIHEDGTWEYTTIRLEAVAAPGWKYVDDPNAFPEETSPVRTFTMDGKDSPVFTVKFAETGDVEALDVIGDFTAFLAAVKPDADALTYDRNVVDHDYENGVSKLKLNPDGIPDVAEFKVIELLLKHPEYSRVNNGGAGHSFVAEDWRRNREHLEKALGEHAKTPGAVTTLACYATLSQFWTGYAARELAREAFGIEISVEGFAGESGRWLNAKDSPSNNGDTNDEVWRRVSAKRTITPELIEKFALTTLGLEK